MSRKIATPWLHAEIAVLAREHAKNPDHLPHFDRHTPADTRDKAIELGLIEKQVKPELTADQIKTVDDDLSSLREWIEPQRTLAIRYAIAQLTALLPKRSPKAAKS